MRKSLAGSFVVGSLMILGCSAAHADTISYFLDQSNIASLPDGTNYLQVTISDGSNGNIDFKVDILAPLLAIADSSGFGIDSFGFNTKGAANAATSASVVSLPGNWSVVSDRNQDGFGRFELIPQTTGANNRVTPTLTFSVSGIAGDSVLDYLVLSGGNAGQGNQFFAAHVAGFQSSGDTSAFFGGSTVAPTPVPLPAAGWLLVSALGGLGFIRRKR